jgi:S-adenosylmethionine hydrolase
MGIITLTTDLGNKDFYLASIKGSILCQLPEVQIIDISHHIPSFNIAQGAYIFKNAYSYFPKKTVHVLGINCDYEKESRFLAIAYRDQYLLGPDNGIFSLILEAEPDKIVEIELFANENSKHFPLKDILIKAACHLSGGGLLANH